MKKGDYRGTTAAQDDLKVDSFPVAAGDNLIIQLSVEKGDYRGATFAEDDIKVDSFLVAAGDNLIV